jgi:hypothetical protein
MRQRPPPDEKCGNGGGGENEAHHARFYPRTPSPASIPSRRSSSSSSSYSYSPRPRNPRTVRGRATTARSHRPQSHPPHVASQNPWLSPARHAATSSQCHFRILDYWTPS